ncbi:hypothetical protein DH2020_022005 [Rehmannia glutinosa]|uniref:Uncharacterized protein n=1 Tax=Rehmannia glutinosa TaxID=99300 RepID=A0ABR0WGC7_REHGL
METHRVQNYEETYNSELMREALDELEEKRKRANMRMEVNRTLMKSAYDKHVRKRNFQVGDLVLRQADTLKKRDKLESNWEGPYMVVKVIRGGAYELEDLEGHKYHYSVFWAESEKYENLDQEEVKKLEPDSRGGRQRQLGPLGQ